MLAALEPEVPLVPVDRNVGSDLALALAEIYSSAEQQILDVMTRQLAAGIESDDWSERKLAAIAALRAQVRRILVRLGGQGGESIEQALVLAYVRGGAAALEEVVHQEAGQLSELGAPGWPSPSTAAAAGSIAAIRTAFPKIDAVQRLVWETAAAVSSTHTRILRWAEDAYRSVVARAAAQVLLGTQTRREATQVAWEQLVDQGITGFIDQPAAAGSSPRTSRWPRGRR